MSTTTPAKPSFEMPPMSPEHQATEKVANRLVELCATGKYREAITELYADNARHVEVMGMPGCSRIVEGKPAILEKADQWDKTTTVHSASCGKPLVNGDQFVCPMSIDCTSSEGPMAGQRMDMNETCLYTVKNGRITEAKFFYSCGM